MNKLLVKAIDRHEYISFDIFDTLLLRTVKNNSDVFYLTGKKVLGDDRAEEFRRERIEFEKLAREHSSSGEITLDDIYNEIKINKHISEENKNLLLLAEQSIEYENLMPREQVINYYNYSIQQNKKVLLISDMYLSSNFIMQVLHKNQIIGFEKLYISCEYGCNKRTGQLFKLVFKDQRIKKKELLHIGDSIKTDILGAIKAGNDFFWIPKQKKKVIVGDI